MNLFDLSGKTAIVTGANTGLGQGIAVALAGAGARVACVGRSSMAEISRDPLDLVAQAHGRHHQYPDGFVLFLGTMFAPTQDRGEPGMGFTHKTGDIVTIAAPELGALVNRMKPSSECEPWTFGITALMGNLAQRGLIRIKSGDRE